MHVTLPFSGLIMKCWKMCGRGISVLVLILLVIPPVHAEQTIYPLLINGTSIYISPGETLHFYQGYSFSIKSISNTDDRAWMVLKLNDTVVRSEVLSPGETFYYNESTSGSERVLISLTVRGIYSGENRDIVTFSPVFQYSDLSLPSATPIPTRTPEIPDNTTNISNSTNDREYSPGFTAFTIAIIICFYRIWVRKSS